MGLLALLAALFAQHVWPPAARSPVLAFYGRLALSTAKRLDAGDRNSGIFAWFVLVAAVLLPITLVALLAASIHPVVLAALDAAVIYWSLTFLRTTAALSAIEKALRGADVRAAAQHLAQWRGESASTEDPGSLARLAIEQGLRDAHHGTFAPLFWFLVLPGPIGLVLYPLAHRAARLWSEGPDPAGRDFGWFAAAAFHVLDWIPSRVSAFAFAVVGDFEDALFCWRSQAAQWLVPGEGIVLASGAGALGVRLGEPVQLGAAPVDRPPLGTGEAAGEDALASLEGLLWRTLVLWLIAFLLAAALSLA
jgi:adenosylcobinamide-phosphate synthase